MCIIEKLNKLVLIWIELLFILTACILHIVFGFSRKEPDFNTYELFNSSPLFNFSLNNNCNNKFKNIFNRWGGWKEERYSRRNHRNVWVRIDDTNIIKLNGNYFCYNNISYIDLLYNGQIIKNGTKCPKEYNKNCGRIDTLNQELCIKEKERCPLYDIGIGLPPDDDNYTYDNDSNIYYNNDNYNVSNKTIIGKLILNDGTPCFHPTEKLWRKFAEIEFEETHLNCTDIQVFGKNSEDRYIEKGEITYKKIYEENLNERAKSKILNDVGEELVNLYKREFYGIDKKCNEKFNLQDNFDNFQNVQYRDKCIQIVEGVLSVIGSSIFLILESVSCCAGNEDRIINPKVYFSMFLIYIIATIAFFIYHVVAFFNTMENDYSGFNCSDSITNEIIRIVNENNKKLMIYNMVSTFTNGIIIAGNFIVITIGIIWDRIDKCKSNIESEMLNQTPGEDETPYFALQKKF